MMSSGLGTSKMRVGLLLVVSPSVDTISKSMTSRSGTITTSSVMRMERYWRVTNMFKLMKLIDGEWYVWGIYSNTDIEKAIKAAFYLGRAGSCVKDVMIAPVEEEQKYV
jgi:hypothetical protein